LTKEPIVLDDILTSSVFTLIAAGIVAVVVVSLQTTPPVESDMTRDLAASPATASSEPMADIADRSPVVVQLPTVVVTGHRVRPSDAEQLADVH